MKKFVSLFLAGAMAAGVLSGCSTAKESSSSSSEKGDSSSVSEAAEQVFTFAGTNDIMSLDSSLMNDEMSALIMYAANEGLVRYNQDKIIQGIAQSQDVSEDGKVYTFHLRDAKWSDGQAVTAGDFE